MDKGLTHVHEKILHRFSGRTLVVATMHGKESVISPLVERHLRVKPKTLKNLDTDQFGTFSGEVERTGSPLETLRKKLYAALSLSNETLGIASEGSFGPHPQCPFIPANVELVMLLDTCTGIEIIGHQISTETNFHSAIVKDWQALHDFAITVGFPNHGIILKTTEGEFIKEIIDMAMLRHIAEVSLSRRITLTVETDMRAMHNPTRMKVIGQATENLLASVFCACPGCSSPGFRIVKSIAGLCCKLCHSPTRIIASYLYECQKCFYSEIRKVSGESDLANPQYCDYCNP